jgi:succinyl-CoA synthetase beta subunit
LKLYEYMAKERFEKFGIPIPKGRTAATPEEAAAICAEIGEVAIKAQVLAGGRGKAGGIGFASTPDEAREVAGRILGSQIRDLTVEKVLVEQKLKIDREIYMGFIVDGSVRRASFIASSHGGMNIEDVPERSIIRVLVDPAWGFLPFNSRQVAVRLGLTGDLGKQAADIAFRLYRVFAAMDAELTEINPLVLSGDRFIAADGRLNIDDDAMYRHKDLPVVLEGTDLEKRVKEMGLSFVQLDGDIAVMANGAGITMATLDVIQRYGGRPANFLDAGGGAGVEATAKAVEVLLATKPKAILINIFGGITRCDQVAQALVQVKRTRGIPVPLVVRMVGTNEAEGVRILRENGLEAYESMDRAAQVVVAAAKGVV